MAKPAFQYKPRDTSSWEKHATQSGSSYIGFIKDEFRTYSIRDNENHGRILPPTWENAEHYGIEVWVHYNVGPQNATVLCLAKMGKGKCPECELRTVLDDAGRPDADDHKPNRRIAVWWIDRKEQDPAKQLQIWPMPWTMDRDISKIAKDPLDGSIYHLDDPDNGYDIFFDVKNSGKGVPKNYGAAQLARKPTSVSDEHLSYAVEHPLPTTLMWRSYEEVKHLMEGDAVTGNSAQAAERPATTQVAERPIPSTEELRPARREAPVVQQPVLCAKTFKAGGKLWGCASQEGHTDDCDFSREVSAGNPQPLGAESSTAAPQGTTRLAPRPMTAAQPAQSSANSADLRSMPATASPSEGKSRADLLRERFKKD